MKIVNFNIDNKLNIGSKALKEGAIIKARVLRLAGAM